jgi:pimeloyl-ACP methyl ester carboxylesterase
MAMTKGRGIAVGLVLLATAAPGLAQSRAGTLELQPYALNTYDGRAHAAELGKLWVPENRTRPGSRPIQITFVRLRSTAARPGPPIVWLAGGPGIPGVAMARVPVYFSLFERLRAAGDVILLDQRGLGLSAPALDCAPTPTPVDAFSSGRRWLAVFAEKSRACARGWRARGADLAGYTHDASADDIEDLRRALGAPQVSLIGHSYGTTLALAAIARHPDSIARAVLAAVEGPDDLMALPRDWEATLSNISAAAAAAAAGGSGSDAVDLGGLFRQALARLRARPATVTITDAISRQPRTIEVGPIGLQWLVRHAMTDARNYAYFPALFRTVAAGDNSILGPRIEGLFNGFQGRSPMANAVDCSRGWSAGRAATARRQARGSPFDMINLQWSGPICRDVGVRRANPSRSARARGPMPVLLLSGSLDANTPPYQAEQVRRGFPNSTHIVVANSGHEMLPSREVQAIVADFLGGADAGGRTVAFAAPTFMTDEEARQPPPARR